MKKIYFLATVILAASTFNAQKISGSLKEIASPGTQLNVQKPQLKSDLLFNQDLNGTNGYGTIYFDYFGGGLYVADDFELDSNSSISKITVYGFTLVSPMQYLKENIEDVTFLIYEDDGDKPKTFSSPLKEFVLENGAAGLTISNDLEETGQFYSISLDFEAANLELDLDGGKKYWVSVIPRHSVANANLRFYWFGATDNVADGIPHLADPSDLFGKGYTDWTSFSDFVTNWGDTGMAFSIEGEDSTMGVSEISNFKALVYHDKAASLLTIATPKGGKVLGTEIYDATGKVVLNSNASSKISTSSLATGVYYVIVKTDKGIQKTKFIK